MPDETDIHTAASGIFDSLPDDPFGDGQDEEPTGTEEDEETPPAGDEDESEEDSSEDEDEASGEEYDDEDESEDDDEGEGDDEAGEDPLYTVRVDGHDEEKTLDELRAGYSRTASWTQKSQALANERRAFEEQQRAVEQERAEYGQGLQTLRQRLEADMPKRPVTNDPNEWVAYQRKSEELAEVQSQQAALQARQQSDHERREQEFLAEQNAKLVEVIPEWADTDVALAEKQGLSSYALGLGYTDTEIDGITDARAILLLRKAKAYDDLDDAKKAVKGKAKKARTLQPGQKKRRKGSGKSKQARSQRDNLKRSGHVRDAAAYIHDTMLGDEF